MNRTIQKDRNMPTAPELAVALWHRAVDFSRLIVFVCLVMVSGLSAAANSCTSRITGNWGTTSTWSNCGGVTPAAGDSVTIESGNTVTLNINSPAIGSLTINAGGELSVTGTNTLTVSGNFSNGGTFVGSGSGAVSIVGAFTNGGNYTSGSGAASITGIFTNSGNFTGGAGGVSLAGNFINSGNFTSGSGTWTFNGAATQSATGAVTFANLAISNAAGVTLNSNLTVSTLLTVNSGDTLTISGTNTLTLGGNFSNAGAFIGGSGAISLAGTFNNTGNFTSGSGTWTFNGIAAQSVTGAVTFSQLTINNANGVTLNSNLTVSKLMNFTKGTIATGNNDLILSANCPSSTSGASATSYVYGNVQLFFPAAAATCIFPVGDSTVYAPITVAVPNFTGIAGGTLTGSTTPGEAPQFATSGIDATQDVNRYWTLGASGDSFTSFPSGGSYSVTLQFATSDISGGTVTNFNVGLYSGAWNALAGSANGTAATLNAQTSFGIFAVGTALGACLPPANAPSGLSCVCDNFGRASLNPSTIFGGSWQLSSSSGSFGVPKIVNSGYLRLTDNSGSDATAATVPGIFPAAGNYISVEFKHYAYNGSGADGMAVTLSDYSVPAVPGAFGGSLGFAQKCQNGVNSCLDDCSTVGGCPGFNGGWIGMALDEFGNYSDPTEGRILGPGANSQSVGLRGPGSGQNGYRWMGGDLSVGGIAESASTAPETGNMYQIIVDARNAASNQVLVYANRDSTTQNGTNYVNLFGGTGGFNAYTEALTAFNSGWTKSVIPNDWQVSFTGSTGGSTDIHEIGGLRICAQTILQPTSGNSSSNFNAIDSAYTLPTNFTTAQQGHIYTKLAGTAFKLGVIAFSGSSINTVYANTVTTQLIDDSGGTASCNVSPSACSSCSKPVIATQAVTFAAANNGQVQTANFTVPSAYSRVITRMCQGTTCSGSTAIGCSSNAFTVRPTSFSSVTSTATNTGLTLAPVFKAGTDPFTLTAVTATGNYTGIPQVNPPTGMQADGVGWTVGALNATTPFPAASGSPSSSTGTFTYGDVGNFTFLGYNPATDFFDARGIYDTSWTALTPHSGLLGSNDATDGDCNSNLVAESGPNADPNAGAYSNVMDLSGKYGCYFGITSNSTFGRFAPDHFSLVSSTVTPAITGASLNGTLNFTYMGQPIPVINYVLNACAGPSPGCLVVTKNYDKSIGYPAVAPVLVAEDQATANQGNNLASRITLGTTIPASPTWSAGQYSIATAFPSSANFSLPGTQPGGGTSSSVANAGGPFDLLELGVNMTDTDGGVIYNNDMNASTVGSCSPSSCNAKQIGNTTSVREGRLVLTNAYGSELLTLPVAVSVQYYNTATATWQLNTADTCGGVTPCTTGATVIPTGGAVTSNATAMVNGATLPTPCFVNGPGLTTCLSSSPQLALNNGGGVGVTQFYLYDSNAKQGSIDMAVDLGAAAVDNSCNLSHPNTAIGGNMTWLRYAWCTSSTGVHDPNARLKFGSSKAPYIYLREMY
jgi:MSHA biogenesis protein MshQ